MKRSDILLRVELSDYLRLRENFKAYEGESVASYFKRVAKEVERWKLKITTES